MKDNCFTEFCCLLSNLNMNQPQVDMYPLLLNLPPISLPTHSSRLIQRARFEFPAAAAKLLQSCPTLCDPIDGSPPGSLVPGILQARTLEWVAISVSNA